MDSLQIPQTQKNDKKQLDDNMMPMLLRFTGTNSQHRSFNLEGIVEQRIRALKSIVYIFLCCFKQRPELMTDLFQISTFSDNH